MFRINNSSNISEVKGSQNKTIPALTQVPNSIIKEVEYRTRSYDQIISGETTSLKIEMFGITHYRYNNCNENDLVNIDGYKVHRECAEAFKKMKAAAKKENLNLSIVSGYRSSTYQIRVFKKKFKDANGNPIYPSPSQMKSRLKYSAPSGFSEHHTGLAIDINSTEVSFKNTKAYRWLLEHAGEYGFEISFPENNAQGLGFEPWHWRYVGVNGENKHIFNQARRNDPRFAEEFSK